MFRTAVLECLKLLTNISEYHEACLPAFFAAWLVWLVYHVRPHACIPCQARSLPPWSRVSADSSLCAERRGQRMLQTAMRLSLGSRGETRVNRMTRLLTVHATRDTLRCAARGPPTAQAGIIEGFGIPAFFPTALVEDDGEGTVPRCSARRRASGREGFACAALRILRRRPRNASLLPVALHTPLCYAAPCLPRPVSQKLRLWKCGSGKAARST